MKSLAALNKYFVKYRVRLLLGFLFVTLTSVLFTFPGVYIGRATNLFENGVSDKWEYIYCGLMVIGFSLAGAFFMFLMRQTLIVMSRFIEFDQKNEIYKHYQSLDQNFYKKNFTGDLMNRISEDVSRVRMYTGPAIMYLANTFATVVSSIVFMVKVDWRMAIVVIAPLPILSFIIYKVSAMINRKSTALQEQLSGITTLTQESFAGIRVIKAYNREKWFMDKLEKESGEYRKRGLSLALTEAFFQPFMIFMVGLSLVLAVYTGGMLTIKGEISAGDISSYVFYIFRLTWPFAALGWVTSLMQRAAASQTRINEFLQITPSVRNLNPDPTPINGSVEFRNVSFTYEETGITALKKFSFRIEEGKSLGIIGHTGAGKSTVAALITRIYNVTDGEILVDGKPVSALNLYDLRSSIGNVPQDVFLFSDTIRNNITFGAGGEVSEEKIIEATKMAGVYDNIIEFPAQFDTLVGERGVTLSGGQKQRISIARAIIKDPRILIFDDCLSAVDTETEGRILSNLTKVMHARTTVFISHRVSGVRSADHILFLKNGEIVEEGNHTELLKKGGEYAALHKLQTLEKRDQ